MSNTECPQISLEIFTKIVGAFAETAQARTSQAEKLVTVADNSVRSAKERYQAIVGQLSDPHALANGQVSVAIVEDAASSVIKSEEEQGSAYRFWETLSDNQIAGVINQQWPVTTTLTAIVQALLATQEMDFAKTDLPITEPETIDETPPEGLTGVSQVIAATLTGLLPASSLTPRRPETPAVPSKAKLKPAATPVTPALAEKQPTVSFDWTPIIQVGLSPKVVGADITVIAERMTDIAGQFDRPDPKLLPENRVRGKKIDFIPVLTAVRQLTFSELNTIFGEDNRRFNRVSRLTDLLIRTAHPEHFQNNQLPKGYNEWLTNTVTCFREETSNDRGVECVNLTYSKGDIAAEKLEEEFERWQCKKRGGNNCPSAYYCRNHYRKNHQHGNNRANSCFTPND